MVQGQAKRGWTVMPGWSLGGWVMGRGMEAHHLLLLLQLTHELPWEGLKYT